MQFCEHLCVLEPPLVQLRYCKHVTTLFTVNNNKKKRTLFREKLIQHTDETYFHPWSQNLSLTQHAPPIYEGNMFARPVFAYCNLIGSELFL